MVETRSIDARRNNQRNVIAHNDQTNQTKEEVGGPSLEQQMWDLTKVVEEIAQQNRQLLQRTINRKERETLKG